MMTLRWERMIRWCQNGAMRVRRSVESVISEENAFQCILFGFVMLA